MRERDSKPLKVCSDAQPSCKMCYKTITSYQFQIDFWISFHHFTSLCCNNFVMKTIVFLLSFRWEFLFEKNIIEEKKVTRMFYIKLFSFKLFCTNRTMKWFLSPANSHEMYLYLKCHFSNSLCFRFSIESYQPNMWDVNVKTRFYFHYSIKPVTLESDRIFAS